MEQSIVVALTILGTIFIIFAAIFTTGEITTKKALAKSLKGQVEKLQSKKLKKGLTLQEENLLAEILEELNAAAQTAINAREERDLLRENARLMDNFQMYVHNGGVKNIPSKELHELRMKIHADNQALGLVA